MALSARRRPVGLPIDYALESEAFGGYEAVIIILEEVAKKKYYCNKCKLILREPYQGPCGHLFCKSCLFLLIGDEPEVDCPACLNVSEIDPEEINEKLSKVTIYLDKAIFREMKKLPAKCPEKGCDWSGIFSRYITEHKTECLLTLVSCESCGRKMTRKDLPNHLIDICEYRSVTCEHCQENYVYINRKDHAERCSDWPVNCDFCKETVNRKQLSRGDHDIHLCAEPAKQLRYIASTLPAEVDQNIFHIPETIDHLRLLIRKVEETPKRGGAAASVVKNKQAGKGIGTLESDGILFSPSCFSNPSYMSNTNDSQQPLKTKSVSETHHTLPLPGSPKSIKKRKKRNVKNRNAEQQSENKPLSGRRETCVDGEVHLRRGGKQHVVEDIVRDTSKWSDVFSGIQLSYENIRDRLHNLHLRRMADDTHAKNLQAKIDILHRQLIGKEKVIKQLTQQMTMRDHQGINGSLTWKIDNISEKRKDAKDKRLLSICSPAFYTNMSGYKMCLRMYLNGDGEGKGTHVSMFLVIMKGNFDALMPWPFARTVTFRIFDQNGNKHDVIERFKPDPTNIAYQRPQENMSAGSGNPRFLKQSEMDNPARGLVVDNTMFVYAEIDCTNLPYH